MKVFLSDALGKANGIGVFFSHLVSGYIITAFPGLAVFQMFGVYCDLVRVFV